MEGRIIAQELLPYGIKTELYPDALAPEAVMKSDAVFLGADMILKNKSVVNKIGSLNLAILSKYYKKPVYVFADKSKFSLKSKFTPDFKPADELWNHEDKNLKIMNRYFEELNKNLITAVFTD
jgi:translation initiation factor 2B subunit (eIF-2B alpha/beta/delta family)